MNKIYIYIYIYMRSKKTFKRSRSTRVRRGSTKRTKNIKRLRIKKTKRKKEKKRNKKEKSKRNLKGGGDYWRSNFDKKMSIFACIGPGTEKSNDRTIEEAKKTANAVSQEENGCKMLKHLYNSHPGRNTTDCLKNNPSDVDKFVNGLTGSSC